MTDYPPLTLYPPDNPPTREMGVWKVYVRRPDGEQEEVDQIVRDLAGWHHGYDTRSYPLSYFCQVWERVCAGYVPALQEAGYRPPRDWTPSPLTFGPAVYHPAEGPDGYARREVEIRLQFLRVGCLVREYGTDFGSWRLRLRNQYRAARRSAMTLYEAKALVGEIGLANLARDPALPPRITFGKRTREPSGLPRGIGGPDYSVPIYADAQLVGQFIRDCRYPVSAANPWLARLWAGLWSLQTRNGTLADLKDAVRGSRVEFPGGLEQPEAVQ